MPTQGESKPDSGALQAAEHVAGAHDLLKVLQDKIGEHPEIRDKHLVGLLQPCLPPTRNSKVVQRRQRAMASSAVRTAKMFSYISPPFRLATFAPARRAAVQFDVTKDPKGWQAENVQAV